MTADQAEIYCWEELHIGMTAFVHFKVSPSDMLAFENLSGDRSRIHKSQSFARFNNFDSPVVYGALTIAKVSKLLGMRLPGDLGLATSWKIDFHNPLYVNEDATIKAELTHISEATKTVSVRFKIFSDHRLDVEGKNKLIAAGSAGAKILKESSF